MNRIIVARETAKRIFEFRLCARGRRSKTRRSRQASKALPKPKAVGHIAMPGSRSSNNESEHKSPRESGDDSEDESEILEESPCGRWLKRKEEVSGLFRAQSRRNSSEIQAAEGYEAIRHPLIDGFAWGGGRYRRAR